MRVYRLFIYIFSSYVCTREIFIFYSHCVNTLEKCFCCGDGREKSSEREGEKRGKKAKTYAVCVDIRKASRDISKVKRKTCFTRKTQQKVVVCDTEKKKEKKSETWKRRAKTAVDSLCRGCLLMTIAIIIKLLNFIIG